MVRDNLPIEELISFIAHETGHLNGKMYKTVLQDEKKAALFEDVALYAYQTAVKMLKKEK